MGQLHVFFFPLLAHGHMLPTIDMAKLFSFRGVKVTLITTHYHASMFLKSIEPTQNLGFDISVRSIDFPSNEAGLPEGIHSLDQAVGNLETLHKFGKACSFMQESLELLLEEFSPNALIADMFYPWANDSAAKFGIPRLLFHGSSTFAMSAAESVRRNKPYKNLKSDSDAFVVPDLPHKIMLTKGQISRHDWQEEEETEMNKQFKAVLDSEDLVYGVVVNSFYELEPDYVDYYKNVLGRRAWHIGPFFLSKTEDHDLEMSQRGGKSAIEAEECLKWLDSKDPNSVVYICFGSMASFKASQLLEIAIGLEESNQEFIWVLSKCIDDQENWLPEDFENRVVKKGLIIKGWAPQMLILEHKSVGAFVTHCGWNSTLEGVCAAGVPFVTWPLFAEQFYNEKLVTDVLRTGISVGCQQWSSGVVAAAPTTTEVIVKREAISSAIRDAMVGDEAIKMRGRAKALKMMAHMAVEESGSSFSDLSALLEDLSSYNCQSLRHTLEEQNRV